MIHVSVGSYFVSAFTMDTILKVQHRISSTLPVRIYRKILRAIRKNSGFRLLSLPLELRRQIYGYYFISTPDIHSTRYHPVETDKNCNIYCLRKCHTKILTVNRQLYCEARDVLYSDTTWHISFNSLNGRPNPEIASTASLQAFRSRPEFGLIKNITVGIMFNTAITKSSWTPEDCNSLKINRKVRDVMSQFFLFETKN